MLVVGHKLKAQIDKEIPWRGMLRCRPLRALIYTHFCNNWFHFSIMAWLPSYFSDTLSLDLTHAAQISLLPPIAGQPLPLNTHFSSFVKQGSWLR